MTEEGMGIMPEPNDESVLWREMRGERKDIAAPIPPMEVAAWIEGRMTSEEQALFEARLAESPETLALLRDFRRTEPSELPEWCASRAKALVAAQRRARSTPAWMRAAAIIVAVAGAGWLGLDMGRRTQSLGLKAFEAQLETNLPIAGIETPYEPQSEDDFR